MKQFSSRPGLYIPDIERQFHSDAPLSPHMISSLLNIEVTLQPPCADREPSLDNSLRHVVWYILTAVISLVVALLLGAILLYAYELGPFEQASVSYF